MDRKSERERFESESVRGASVLQSKTADGLRRPEDERRVAVRVGDRDPRLRIALDIDDRRAHFGLAGHELVAAGVARIRRRLIVEPGAAETGEEHAADAADDADR